MKGICYLLLMLVNRNFFWYTKNICTMCSGSYFHSNASEGAGIIHYYVWTQRTYPGQQRNATSIINQIYEIIILRFREVSYIKCIIVYFYFSLLFFLSFQQQLYIRESLRIYAPRYLKIFAAWYECSTFSFFLY